MEITALRCEGARETATAVREVVGLLINFVRSAPPVPLCRSETTSTDHPPPPRYVVYNAVLRKSLTGAFTFIMYYLYYIITATIILKVYYTTFGKPKTIYNLGAVRK